MDDLESQVIQGDATISEALSRLNEHSGDILLLFVLDDEKKLIGAITDGDIRRGLIKGASVSDKVITVMNGGVTKASINDNLELITRELDPGEIKLLPVVNLKGELVEIINPIEYKIKLPVEAVIMAGGRGERLRPMTDKIPKPLLKVGGKPIVEYNVERLRNHGIDNLHFSIKYLGNEIVKYFKDGKSKGVKISYVTENEPLGTIGALSLIEDLSKENVLVMNSDLLTDIDFTDFVEEFLKSKADLMVATIPYQVSIPYAVLETTEHKVTSLKEKPTYTYQSNAGIYIMKRSVVDFIPNNNFFNATDLMELLLLKEMKVAYYPVLGYWLDIGKPQDFEKAQVDIKHLKL